MVHWYSSPDSGIDYGEEIDALRRACVRVRSESQDDRTRELGRENRARKETAQHIDARVELLRLATSVMRFHDTPPFTDESASREADMQALVRLLREDAKVGDLDDPERLVADLRRDDAIGDKAASRIAVILKRLGSSTYDVAIKIITDIGSAAVKKMLGL